MYLGRIVEQGSAVDVIERPQHPYTQALVDAVPVPTAGGGGRRELLGGELPDATDVPSGCRFHPRCPRRFEPCDRVDPPLLAARRARPAGRLPASRRRSGFAGRIGGRWLSGGASSPARSGCSSRVAVTRSPTSPGSGSATSQAASGQRTGVTVVAPPALPAPRRHALSSTAWASSPRSSRSMSAGRSRPRSTCAARTRSGPSTRPRSAPRGAARTTIVLPVVGECDDGDCADSREVVDR